MGLASFKSENSKHAFTVDTTDVSFVQVMGEGKKNVVAIYLRHTEKPIVIQFPSYDMAEEVYDIILHHMQEDEDAFDEFDDFDNLDDLEDDDDEDEEDEGDDGEDKPAR